MTARTNGAPSAPRACSSLLACAGRLILIGALWLVAEPALAHSDAGLVGGFLAGFSHPLNGPDHLLAMVAVGLWGAFLGRPLIYVLPVLFPAIMAAGGVLGLAGLPFPFVELGIALSVLVLGLLIAGARTLPIAPAVAIVAAFAVCHGYAHGQELPLAADPVGYSLGFVLATGLLHVLGIAIGELGRRSAALALAPRLAGAAIAVAGAWFLFSATAA
ncbi:MAG: Nickel-binding accessory protein UreJ-HupE [uncultured Sphingomonadaceae bacterium]|uniref:Nickel-binding accessory protein UreJ-HupE n=1 Tax=uncultured Sphingomonadaceae bacterium TaxID=169976 RepID=A0A6J4TIK9_9SPHN|nr:MAG: Nickel-binding accessory protein UreJ-HupE [uncultured Sphingomonadaceae bacterium]